MSNDFEGWYYKHQKGPDTLAVIAGRAKDDAFIQVITQEGSYCARYSFSKYQKRKTLHLENNHFTQNFIRLSVSNKDLELDGHLFYGTLSPIKGDIMGPFRFLPMQCRHTVISMNHTLMGKVRLNGREIDFTGGRGYIEGDSGRSFPKSYTWVQCNHFPENCSIMASAAHIPFAWSWFWGCIGVIWLDGMEYRLATYLGAKIKHRDERQLWLIQKDLSLKILFLQTHDGHKLEAPEKGSMKRRIHEVPSAPASFEFRKGDRILFQGTSQFCSYEHVCAEA